MECIPGSSRCDGPTTIVECGIDGLWVAAVACPYACVGERCSGECVPDTSECVSSTRRRSCGFDGTWLGPEECPAACLDGQCGGSCIPNQTRCASPTSVETCNERGEWGAATPCENACVGASCTGECTPGETRCFSETRQQACGEQGQWQAAEVCTAACIGSACGGECFPNSTRCTSARELQSCGLDGFWTPPALCANACVGSGCGGECVPGARRCAPNSLAPQVCNTAGTWDTEAPCPFACGGAGECSGECVTGTRRCGPTGVPQQCVASRWQGQAACPGVCSGAGLCTGECTPGATATCGQIHGARGECSARTLTCTATGQWPQNQSCTTTSAEDCGNQRDDDCDGLVDEDPPCTRFIAVGAGESHTCGLLSDGTVRCWGANDVFQLGSDEDRASRPREVAGLTGVRQLSVGRHHACVIVAPQGGRAARVLCWGDNEDGQVGAAGSTSTPRATEIPGAGTAQIVASYNSSCALDIAGTPRCWGSARTTPPGRFLDFQPASTHQCGLTAQSSVVYAGNNGAGQLGDGSFESRLDEFADVVGLSGAVRKLVVSQVIHNCAVLGDGRLQCWGFNGSGQLGDGTRVDRSLPTFVPGLTAVTDVALGYFHSCALQNSDVYCWGGNEDGQIGTGSPAEIITSPTRISGLTGVIDIAAGWNHTCAVLSDGTIRCWGANADGQLGNDNTSSSTVPVRTLGP